MAAQMSDQETQLYGFCTGIVIRRRDQGAISQSFHYARKSQKRKKQSNWAAFCALGICGQKSSKKTQWWNWPQVSFREVGLLYQWRQSNNIFTDFLPMNKSQIVLNQVSFARYWRVGLGRCLQSICYGFSSILYRDVKLAAFEQPTGGPIKGLLQPPKKNFVAKIYLRCN